MDTKNLWKSTELITMGITHLRTADGSRTMSIHKTVVDLLCKKESHFEKQNTALYTVPVFRFTTGTFTLGLTILMKKLLKPESKLK